MTDRRKYDWRWFHILWENLKIFIKSCKGKCKWDDWPQEIWLKMISYSVRKS